MPSLRLLRLCLLTVLAAGCGSRERPASGDESTSAAVSPAADSAAAFAQRFYDWYARDSMRFEATVRDSGAWFAPQLLSALRADIAASARNPGEVVGLDWDPFVASQDPCPGYRVGRPTERDGRVLVPVTGDCGQRPAGTAPDVMAELVRQGPAWSFSNFRHGSDSGSVLSDLAELKRERDRHQ